MIIDGHVHIASDRFLPRSFVEGSLANVEVALRAQGVPAKLSTLCEIYAASMQDHDADAFVRSMDEAAVELAVALAPDFSFALPDSPLNAAELAEAHYRIAQRHPDRLVMLGGPDPRWGQDGLDLLARCLGEYGFRGYKLYPPCGYGASDRILYPFYELCQQHGVPVLLHTGPTSSALLFEPARPGTVDQAARDFPGVNFILAHGGVHEVEQALAQAAFRPNVYLDLSGYAGAPGSGGPRELILRCLRADLAHKIIFGTDWPVFSLTRSYRSLVDVIRAPEIVGALPRRGYDLVVSGNIRRLLGLPKARPAA